MKYILIIITHGAYNTYVHHIVYNTEEAAKQAKLEITKSARVICVITPMGIIE